MAAVGALALTLLFLNPALAWTALVRLADPFGGASWPLQTRLELEPVRPRMLHPQSVAASAPDSGIASCDYARDLPLLFSAARAAGLRVRRLQVIAFGISGLIVGSAGFAAAPVMAIANDSGIGHLLAALGTPLISLFGPTDPARWRPFGRSVVLLRAQDFGGDTMDAIPVGPVFAAVQAAIAKPRVLFTPARA